LAQDAAGWEQLWLGVAEAGAVVLLGLGLLAWLGWRLMHSRQPGEPKRRL